MFFGIKKIQLFAQHTSAAQNYWNFSFGVNWVFQRLFHDQIRRGSTTNLNMKQSLNNPI